jgi:hypothetical protein
MCLTDVFYTGCFTTSLLCIDSVSGQCGAVAVYRCMQGKINQSTNQMTMVFLHLNEILLNNHSKCPPWLSMHNLAYSKQEFTASWNISAASIIWCLFITMLMEAVHTSETSVYFETNWRYSPESCHLHTCLSENLKSHMTNYIIMIHGLCSSNIACFTSNPTGRSLYSLTFGVFCHDMIGFTGPRFQGHYQALLQLGKLSFQHNTMKF